MAAADLNAIRATVETIASQALAQMLSSRMATV